MDLTGRAVYPPSCCTPTLSRGTTYKGMVSCVTLRAGHFKKKKESPVKVLTSSASRVSGVHLRISLRVSVFRCQQEESVGTLRCDTQLGL